MIMKIIFLIDYHNTHVMNINSYIVYNNTHNFQDHFPNSLPQHPVMNFNSYVVYHHTHDYKDKFPNSLPQHS